MFRNLLVLLAIWIANQQLPCLAQEQGTEPASEISTLQEQFVRATDVIEAKHQQELNELKKKLATELQKLMTQYTQAGDLENAIAVRDEISKLQNNSEGEGEGGNQWLRGTYWVTSNAGEFHWDENGEFYQGAKAKPSFSIAPNVVLIVFNPKTLGIIHFDDTRQSFQQQSLNLDSPNQRGITGRRSETR